jgi:lactoylglutathione lyase
MSKFLHTMLRVTSIEKTLRFFSLIGFKEISRRDNDAGRFTLIFLAAEDDYNQALKTKAPLIELTYNWDESGYDGGRNFGHLAISVDNIYETCERLIENEIPINRPPRDGRMAFIKTPDNISIELLQSGQALQIMEPWSSMPNIDSW